MSGGQMNGFTAWPLDPVVNGAGAVLFALVFALAAWHKARDRDEFSRTLAAYRLVPASLLMPVTTMLAVIEGLLVALLALPGTRASAFAVAAGLLLLYAAAMAVNLARGRREIDCGCGGPGQRLSWALPARNGLLAALGFAWSLPVIERPLDGSDRAVFVAIALALCGLYLVADELIRQGTRLGALQRALREDRA